MFNQDCAVCLQKVETAYVLDCAQAGCSSIYHAECAEQCLNMRGMCPACRRSVSSNITPITTFWHDSARSQIKTKEVCISHLETCKELCNTLQDNVSFLQQEHQSTRSDMQALICELQNVFKYIREDSAQTNNKIDNLQAKCDKSISTIDNTNIQFQITFPERKY